VLALATTQHVTLLYIVFVYLVTLVCCRMLMCPWGSSLLLGNANGGIRRLQIGSDDPVEHRPKLVEVSGQQLRMLVPGQHASRRTSSGRFCSVSSRACWRQVSMLADVTLLPQVGDRSHARCCHVGCFEEGASVLRNSKHVPRHQCDERMPGQL
jgi:hypothetical protein